MKKLLALVALTSVLASSMVSVHAVYPTLDDLIYESHRRTRWAISSDYGSVEKQMDDINEALCINRELSKLKASGEPVSDEILNEYIKRLNAIGVNFALSIDI